MNVGVQPVTIALYHMILVVNSERHFNIKMKKKKNISV